MTTKFNPRPLLQAVFARPAAPALTLFGVCFCIATRLQLPHETLQDRRRAPADLLSGLLGEGRKLFANHFYIKADAYFHSGYYPSIFDNRESHQTPHMAEDAGVTASRNTGNEETFLGTPSDWIDAHGRKHFPSRHTHLGVDAPGGGGDGQEREILPWLELASTLDPNHVETYTVAAYWLRRVGHPAEAEKFLRDGLRENPQSAEIIFELGRCRFDANDTDRARNLWAHAWRCWQQQESAKPTAEQDRFLAGKILMNLARLESLAGQPEACVRWLETLLPVAVRPENVQRSIGGTLPSRRGHRSRWRAKAAQARRRS
jgi:tetratricopeptide (TPR) repeat protein